MRMNPCVSNSETLSTLPVPQPCLALTHVQHGVAVANLVLLYYYSCNH